ncbi:hypothetical protein [Aquimarina sp. 433]
MNNYIKILILIILPFTVSSAYSQLNKYNFEEYKFDSQESLEGAKEDVLSVANLLLKQPITEKEELRYEAGFFLNDWMKNIDNYSFGTGNLKNLFDEKIELMIISMASQIKYCLENKKNNSYEIESRLGIWKIITEYIENPKNKVKLTKKLKSLIKAKNENKLAEFLDANE